MIDRQSLLEFFKKHFPGWRQTCFIIGVSGGIDSMCLLDCLYKAGIPIIAAHYNHQLRSEAEEDAQFVKRLAADYSIPFVYGEGDVNSFAKTARKSIEESARTLRYQFLFQMARDLHCSGVITAHHADDQVETVLMHLLRGSGLEGIKGMLPISVIPEYDARLPLIRPFLEQWRSEMCEYAQENAILFREDVSNFDTQFYRNRIRQELLPLLATYNPQAKQHLLQTASILVEDYQTLHKLTACQYGQCVIREQEGVMELSRPQFLALGLGQQRNLLRLIINRLCPQLRDIDFHSIQLMIDWITWGLENHMAKLHSDLCLFNQQNSTAIGTPSRVELWVQNKYPQCDGINLELSLQEGGAVDLPGGHRLLWDVCKRESLPTSGDFHSSSPLEAWIDLDMVDGAIRLRPFSPGDRMEPLGMPGKHSKLSDIFVNEKIPRVVRKTYPVLCSNSQVCWLPGLMVSEFCKITSRSYRIAHFQWVIPKDQV